MGFLSAYSGTQRITIGDPERGYWVEIREHIQQGAKEKAEQALQGRQRVNGGDVEMTMDVATYRQLMVLAAVANWNLDDDNGYVWPINIQNVRRLPGAEFDHIWAIVDKLNAPAGAKERRQFPDEGDGVDQVGVEPTTVAGDVLDGAATVAAPGTEAGGPGDTPLA